MKPLIVIPARNESSTIGDIVKEIKKTILCDVLVVDDASGDKTVQNSRDAGAIVLKLCTQLGAWGAIRTGFRYALNHQYDYVVTMDADGQHISESILDLLLAIESSNADVIIGSAIDRGSNYKKLAWYVFRKLASLKINDLTSGLRVYNRCAVKLLLSNNTTSFMYQDLGVLLTLKRYGLKISEIQVKMTLRKEGHSQIFNSWIAIIRYLVFSFILCLTYTKKEMKSK